MLTIALPKGRLLAPTVGLFRRAGIRVSASGGPPTPRRLIVTSPGNGYRFMLIRDVDVPTYVEHGAADLGIVGRDILLEQRREVYEPLDLKYGRCRLIVAGPRDASPRSSSLAPLRVATKYPAVAERHFAQQGIPVEIIRLGGSMELAPLAGLAGVIVDVVESGRTLRAHRLVEFEVIAESTARLIVNRSSLKLRYDEITRLIRRLSREIREARAR